MGTNRVLGQFRPTTAVRATTVAITALFSALMLLVAAPRGVSQGSRAPNTRLMYAENRLDSTSIWDADPVQPSRRSEILRFAHARGWTGRYSVSPDESHLAFTVVTLDSSKLQLRTDLYLLDLLTSHVSLLLDKVNLYVPPLWSADSKSMYITRTELTDAVSDSASTSVFEVSLDGHSVKELFKSSSNLIWPVMSSPKRGDLVYYSASQLGNSVGIYNRSRGAAETVIPLGKTSARNFQAADDSRFIVFLTTTTGAPRQNLQALDLDTRSTFTVVGGRKLNVLNAFWSNDSNRLIVSEGTDESSRISEYELRAGSATTRHGFAITPAAGSEQFAISLSESESGRFELIRHLSKGVERFYVWDKDSKARFPLPDSMDIDPIGWYSGPLREVPDAAEKLEMPSLDRGLMDSLASSSCPVAASSGSQPSDSDFQKDFDSAASNSLGSLGPTLPAIYTGYPTSTKANAHVAKLLIRAVGWAESSWTQFKSGKTLISGDCGYGVMQITSGMSCPLNCSWSPSRVASEAPYNVGTGAYTLIEKWNSTKSIGNNDPAIYEDWYYATWGYNGFGTPPGSIGTQPNNPNAPFYSNPFPAFNGSNRSKMPYQEMIWSLLRNPTAVPGLVSRSLWDAQPITSPNRSLFPYPSTPSQLPHIDTPLPAHSDSSLPTAATPTFSPSGGIYTSAQSVTISDSTNGAMIYYTADGTTPTTSSTKYTAPIKVSSSETLSAIATANGYSTSTVRKATYTISSTTTPSISSVSPNPVTGSNSAQPFTISGTGFTSSTTVTLGNQYNTYPNRPISSWSASQIVINPNFGTTAAQWWVQVNNGSLYSSKYYFNVQ